MKQEHSDSHTALWTTFFTMAAGGLLLYAIVTGASVCDLTLPGILSCA